jgi:antitoxin component YwqK of YwqJK toxin-antitoxin module
MTHPPDCGGGSQAMKIAVRSPSPYCMEMADSSGPVPHVEHYANGIVKMTGFHLDGEMHGAWDFYRTDGSTMRSGEFDRGKQVGVWRTFDRSGRLVKETDFGEGR